MPGEDGEALAQIVPPELQELLRARTLLLARPVWGRRYGRHRSARAGMGLDFRDHRAYAPGDDPRMLDWRAVARRDRLVLRQTEAEDELNLVLLMDLSGGMNYGEGPSHKGRLAKALAGGLTWLASRQGDPVGIALGRDAAVDLTLARPLSGHDRVVAMARQLGNVEPSGVCPWIDLIDAMAPRLPRRSVVVVLTDYLDPSGSGEGNAEPDERDEAPLRALAGLRARGHDVVLVQLLHPDEVTFPWTERRMMRFRDLLRRRPDIEGPGAGLREGYLERLRAHLRWLEGQCEREGLFLERVRTDRPLPEIFVALLARLAGAPAPDLDVMEAPR